MIRKAILAIRHAIIIVLTLAAVGTAAAWAAGHVCFEENQFVLGSFSCSVRCDRWLCGWSLGYHPSALFVSSSGSLGLVCYVDKATGSPDFSMFWGPFGIQCADLGDIGSGFTRRSGVYLPFWAPMILFATYPTIAFIRGPLRRWRRRRKGLCLKCAYDLTGNVSGVCPECGTKVESK